MDIRNLITISWLTVHISNAALAGDCSIKVATDPPAALVSLQGEEKGTTPITFSIPCDRPSQLELSLDGYQFMTTEVGPRKGVTTVFQSLKRSPTGKLLLTVNKNARVIWIENLLLKEKYHIIKRANSKDLKEADEKFANRDFMGSRTLCEKSLKTAPEDVEARRCLIRAKWELSRLAYKAYTKGTISESIAKEAKDPHRAKDKIEAAKKSWKQGLAYVKPGDEYYSKIVQKLSGTSPPIDKAPIWEKSSHDLYFSETPIAEMPGNKPVELSFPVGDIELRFVNEDLKLNGSHHFNIIEDKTISEIVDMNDFKREPGVRQNDGIKPSRDCKRFVEYKHENLIPCQKDTLGESCQLEITSSPSNAWVDTGIYYPNSPVTDAINSPSTGYGTTPICVRVPCHESFVLSLIPDDCDHGRHIEATRIEKDGKLNIKLKPR